MCRQVPDLEWSGVLFYKTEGEFGTDNFKCIAKELYLMDIGTAGHTEYEFGPDFTTLLMQREDLRKEHYKGHIHSHNNMGVFFSGTDERELYGNCHNHNLYLSLIVNNKNQMCARIAFQAVQKNITLEYKDERGKPKSHIVEHVNEDPVIFEYECDVKFPPEGAALNDIVERIESIREKKFEKSSGGRTGGSFPGFSQSLQTPQRTFNTTDARVYDFVIKLVNLDPKTTGSLTRTFERMSESNFQGQRLDNHIVSMDERLEEFYLRRFPEDKRFNNFSDTMREAAKLLEEHTKRFPMVKEIQEFFRNKTKPGYNYNDSESNDYRGYA